jgi:hypothetical protein
VYDVTLCFQADVQTSETTKKSVSFGRSQALISGKRILGCILLMLVGITEPQYRLLEAMLHTQSAPRRGVAC